MKMEKEIPVLTGFLNVPTQSGFSLNRISKKKSTQRYCLLFKSSRHGMERLEICESKDDKNPKIITLENCVKITQEPSPANQIQIVKMTGTLTVNTSSEKELQQWVTAFQSVAFKDKNGNGSCTNTNSLNASKEEDNDLYCSSYGDGLFMVKLIPSEASQRCKMELKNYMLQLTATELQLKSPEDTSTIVAKWPYRFIRKYGYREGKFTFEAGRKCSTGEGVFQLDHTNPQEIFRCMSSKMKSMKKLISGESINTLDCGENHLTAAAQMEAGSRSPLPPSPNYQQSASDLENSFNSSQNHSSISIRGFLSSNDSLNNVSINSITSPNSSHLPSLLLPLKVIPNKPPRKLIPLVAHNVNTTSLTTTTSNPTSPTSEKMLNTQLIPSLNSLPTAISPCDIPNIISSFVSSANDSTATLSQNSERLLKKHRIFEPVAITNDQTSNSTVLLNSPPSDLNIRTPSPQFGNTLIGNNLSQLHLKKDSNSLDKPPDLPLRNENVKRNKMEQNYELVENITDAWKTRGVSEVKHTEHITNIPDDDVVDVSWQRTQSQHEGHKIKKDLSKTSNLVRTSVNSSTSLTLNSIGTNTNESISDQNLENNYDVLDFLSPNNKNSFSGYKTIVAVSSSNSNTTSNKLTSNNASNSSHSNDLDLTNHYEFIDTSTEQSTSTDENFLGSDFFRKPSTPGPQVPSIAQKNTTDVLGDEKFIDHHLNKNKYSGINYAIVSKPKRV